MTQSSTVSGRRETALITGASSGFGYEFAKLFAGDGYNLVLVARSEDKLTELARDVEARYGVSAHVLPRDLSQPNAPDEIYDELQRQSVNVDVLVNNAGFGTRGPFAQLDLAAELQEVQVNIASLTHLTRLFLPDMVSRKRGKILNVASMAAFVPGPFMAVYYASKAYILSFSEALSSELAGTGVTVTALCPGPVRTGFQARAEMQHARLVRGNLMTAERVARLGYDGLMKGKRVVVPGFQNRVTTIALPFIPRQLLLRIVRNLHKD